MIDYYQKYHNLNDFLEQITKLFLVIFPSN
ncbi:hypothetical protein SD457_04940 [Coprobacillaceae bacterium CR2/5/TPMF4]|nr:hypothetical protein SD457_04940 [Coprobacillaceae bacterium CR2/5/TPMF4]